MSESPKVPVSVLIPAKNEESHIVDCIRSVAWAGEVVVVDSHSQDRTIELATAAGARVVQFDYKPAGPKKKNWALQNVSFAHEWILILDADERITPELAGEIARAVASPQGHAGWYVNRRFYFLGRWIRHAGYYPSWNLRLLRLGAGLYETLGAVETNSGDNEVHEHIVLEGTAGYLREPMDHFAYPSIDVFLEKHNRYSNWEVALGANASATLGAAGTRAGAAAVNWRRSLKAWGRQFPFPHWLRFFYHYFGKLGVLDGRAGYIFCHLLAEYEFLIWAKTHEARSSAGSGHLLTGGRQPVARHATAAR